MSIRSRHKGRRHKPWKQLLHSVSPPLSLTSCPAGDTYNSITCSLATNDFVPLVCGSLEQNWRHGWPVSALPRSLLPPLMTPETSVQQNVSILTSHQYSGADLHRQPSQSSGFLIYSGPLLFCFFAFTSAWLNLCPVFPFLKVNSLSKHQSASWARARLVLLH